MLMCYLFQTTKDKEYKVEWSPIYNLDETFRVLKDYITHFESFVGVKGLKFEDEKIKDSAIINQKRK